MDRDDMWDAIWRSSPIDASLSLQSLAAKAFSLFRGWISDEDRLILEVGSGGGRFCLAMARTLPTSRVTGVDISPDALALSNMARFHLGVQNAQFIRGDLFCLPFGDGTFDVVFSEGVIEHFTNVEMAVLEMARVTRPGGKVIVSVPNWWCLPHTFYKTLARGRYEYGYETSFRMAELKAVLHGTGLNVIGTGGFDPTYSLRRLRYKGGICGVALNAIAQAADRFIEPLDRKLGHAMSRTFGFEIAIVAKRP